MLEREFSIGNLLVRIHMIIEMIWWTGLAPWGLNSLLQKPYNLPMRNEATIGLEPSQRE